MVGPFKVLQKSFDFRFQRFGIGVPTLALISVKIQLAQADQAHVMTRMLSGLSVSFRKQLRQRTRTWVTVQNNNAFGFHLRFSNKSDRGHLLG